MRWGQLLLCGWPGLAQLWLRGHGASLLMAVGFSILLNLALVSTFLWPDLLGDTFPIVAWPIIIVSGLVSFFVSYRKMPAWASPPRMAADLQRDRICRESADQTDSAEIPLTEEAEEIEADERSRLSSDTLFNRAQHEYLKGHWCEAETLLNRRIEVSQRDVESRLMLATLYRHTGRPDEAKNELKAIERFDDAIHWRFEIDRERQLIAEVQKEFDEYENKTDSTETDGEIDAVENLDMKTIGNADSLAFQQPEKTQQEGRSEEFDLGESSNVWLC